MRLKYSKSKNEITVLYVNVNNFGRHKVKPTRNHNKYKYTESLNKWYEETEKESPNLINEFISFISMQNADIIAIHEFDNKLNSNRVSNFLEGVGVNDKSENGYTIIYPMNSSGEKWCSGGSISLMLVSNRIMNDISQKRGPKEIEDKKNCYKWAKWIEIEYGDFSIITVHVPIGNELNRPIRLDSVLFWDAIHRRVLKRMNENKKVVVIGDMNVNPKVLTTSTYKVELLKHICVKNRNIVDAWEYCIENGKSFIVNAENRELKSNKINKDTTIFGTRIDYAFCSSDINIKKMVINDKAREITDHSAIKLTMERDE